MASAYFILRAIRKNRPLEKNMLLCNEPLKCRTCLNEGSIPINDSTDISEALRIFCDVQIIEGDSLPQHLCPECHSFLQRAVHFRKTAKECDTKLREALNVVQSEPITIVPSTTSHPKTSIKPTSFKCHICNLTFKRYKDYALHRKTINHRNVKRRCSLCNKLITKTLFQKHLLRHQSNFHVVCEVCGKLFRKDNLARHVQTHSSEFPYQCEICPYKGRCVYSLAMHMKSHTGEKPFSCNVCHLRFLTRGNLNKHIVTHSKERPFKCIECGKDFRRKTDLDIHLRSVHTTFKNTSKVFDCKLCDTMFGSKRTLLRHEIRIHKREKRTGGRLPLYLKDENKYQTQIENYDGL